MHSRRHRLSKFFLNLLFWKSFQKTCWQWQVQLLFFCFPSSPWCNFIPNKCCPGSNLRFSSCLSQICQEPVPWQDQPEHTEGRGPADQPGAGRGGPPEPAGPAHMAGHQPCVLQQGRHPGEWGTNAGCCELRSVLQWWVKQPAKTSRLAPIFRPLLALCRALIYKPYPGMNKCRRWHTLEMLNEAAV